jgi:hypothetical protein
VSAVRRKGTGPMHGLIIFRPDFAAFQLIGCNNWIHGASLDFRCARVNHGSGSPAVRPSMKSAMH